MARLLVVRFSALGDLASTAPFLSSATSEHEITLLTSPLGKAYFKDSDYIHEIIELKDKRVTTLIKLIPRVFRSFDYFVDLHGSDRSRFLSLFAGCERLSNYVANYQNLQPEESLAGYVKPGSASQFDYYSILSMLPGYCFEPKPFVTRSKSYVVLNIGSSEKWRSKRLPVEKWQQIVSRLNERFGLRYVLTGAAEEVGYITEVARQLPGDCEIVAGKTDLGALKSILRGAYLTVSTDSGPMHMSAVEGTPTIGLFGPTNWVRSAPYGPWSTVLFDPIRYPDASPPAKSLLQEDDYFRHIDIDRGLEQIEPYLGLDD